MKYLKALGFVMSCFGCAVFGAWLVMPAKTYQEFPTITAIGVYDAGSPVPQHILRSEGDGCDFKFGVRVVAIRLERNWMITKVNGPTGSAMMEAKGGTCVITGPSGTLMMDSGEPDDSYSISMSTR